MSEKNAIAHTLLQLPAFQRLSELWARLPDETEQDYWAFLEWLDGGTKRGAPRATFTDTAARHDWAQRAVAYDRAAIIQADLERTGQSPEQKIVGSLTQTLLLECDKLLKQAGGTGDLVVGVKDITAIIGLLATMQKNAIKAESSKVDLSKLSTDELRQVLGAQAILRRTGGGQ